MERISLKSKDENLNFALRKCVEFLEEHGSDIELRRYDIPDTEIFMKASEYNTRAYEESKWEAHKKYADLQVILEGEEKIYVSDISNMTLGEYREEKDFLECSGNSECAVNMDTEYGLLLMPDDAHMPGVNFGDSSTLVKKCVFKIPLKYFC